MISTQSGLTIAVITEQAGRSRFRAISAAYAFGVAACTGHPEDTMTRCTSAAITGGTAHGEFMAIHPNQELALPALQIIDGFDQTLAVCSGTVVGSNIVLTAKHCVTEQPGKAVVLFRVDADSAPSPVTISRITIHPTLDLALLQLPIGSTELIGAQPITTAHKELIQVDNLVQIAGVGLSVARLRELQFAVSRVQEVTDTTFRVDAGGRAGACDGDSGGPALLRDSTGRLTVVGVLSRGAVTCAASDEYVRLAPVADWLESNGLSRLNAEPVLADCTLLHGEGRCFGDVAVWCEGTSIYSQSCESGTSCGFSFDTHGYRCVRSGADSCMGVNDRGQCRDNDRLRCIDGVVVFDPCAECNAICRYSVRTGSAICNANAPE